MQQNNKFYNIKNGAIKCCTNCTFETGRSVNPNCHSYCEKYLNEREELDKRNKEKFDKKEIEQAVNSIRIESVNHMKNRRHRQ